MLGAVAPSSMPVHWQGTVHGVLNSVAGVGGAVTDTVSKLSFDRDYQMKREMSKNKAMANQGGVGQGLTQVRGPHRLVRTNMFMRIALTPTKRTSF